MFGVPLHSLRSVKNTAPPFIPLVSRALISNCTTPELFRRAGNNATIQNLGVVLNLADPVIPPEATVHDLASFLKLWLRSLPDPLLTPFIVNSFYVTGHPNSAAEILIRLDPTTRLTTAHVFAILRAILNESEVNEMTMGTLAICFLSSLLQNGKGLVPGFKFREFYEWAVEYLNDAGDDFNLPS
jgi:hypothetical protein